MKRTVEIDDTLPDIISYTWDEIEELLKDYLTEHSDGSEPETPCLHGDLDYNGSVHDIIDSATPIYNGEIADCFYLHGDDIEQAFDDAGIGGKSDDGWPCGWKAAAIYTYIEQEIAERYYREADEIVSEWWAENRPACRAASDRDAGCFDGLVVSDTADVPDDYSGEVLHVNDHGNVTLYTAEDGELDEVDAIV